MPDVSNKLPVPVAVVKNGYREWVAQHPLLVSWAYPVVALVVGLYLGMFVL